MVEIPAGTVKRIHVNQHHIRHNAAAKAADRKPTLTVKTSKANHKGDDVQIDGPSRLVYRPDKPLDCGAKVWIETTARVVVN